MFESGQVGGGGMQAVGSVVGALGGISSVALGVTAGLGAVAMGLQVFDSRMKEAVDSIRAGTAANDAQRRAARTTLQQEMEKGLAGDLGADLSALESAGISPALTTGMRGLAARAVRASGGDAAKRLMATAEKAAKTYNMTPESAMEALLQAKAGRLPAEALEQRAPLIFAKELGATSARRLEMRKQWAEGAPKTWYGKEAEFFRGEVGYAEGKRYDTWQKNYQRMADRDWEIRNKLDAAKSRPERFVLHSELEALEVERNLTRSIADDPTALEKAVDLRKQIEVINNLTEKKIKQSGFVKFISSATELLSFGVWEDLDAQIKRQTAQYQEENRRKAVSADAP
jgi:hypothetical protein